MISDGFLGWTLDSANKLGIPRLVYYGMNYFSTAVTSSVFSAGLIVKTDGDDEPFMVPKFPWLSITRNDFDVPFRDRNPKGQFFDFTMETIVDTANSHGIVMNSFYELEPVYVEHYNANCVPKAWPVGPLCLAEPPRKQPPENQENPCYVKWLDCCLENGKQVLYVAFGSQAEISTEQLKEIKAGLEESEVNFLWVVRTNESELYGDGFEERVKNRGLLVKEWVDQREILGHRSVNGFLSHCGWNSVIESICAAVPIAAWPMMAEQHLNARMVVEEIKIGVRVESCNGSVRGFVKSEGVEKAVRELMEGEIGKNARKNVKEISESAINAMKEGGSSWVKLDELINEFHAKRNSDK